jgi:hypothetical protein
LSDTLINTGKMAMFVDVLEPDGKTVDTITLQPGGKLTLPAGYTVHPEFIAAQHPKVFLNGKSLRNRQGA